MVCNKMLASGFKHFLFCTPKTGEMESNLNCAYFSSGLVQPPRSCMAAGPPPLRKVKPKHGRCGEGGNEFWARKKGSFLEGKWDKCDYNLASI